MKSISFDEYIGSNEAKINTHGYQKELALSLIDPPSPDDYNDDRNADDVTFKKYVEKRDDFDTNLNRQPSSVKHVHFLYDLSADRQKEGKKIREMIEAKKMSSTKFDNDYLSKKKTVSKSHILSNGRILELYNLSSAKQEEGKRLRETIQEKITNKDALVEYKRLSSHGPINDRVLELYNRSSARQKEGKEKRETVRVKVANKNFVRTEYPKLPPNRHTHLYDISMIFATKRDIKLEEMRNKLNCSVH